MLLILKQRGRCVICHCYAENAAQVNNFLATVCLTPVPLTEQTGGFLGSAPSETQSSSLGPTHCRCAPSSAFPSLSPPSPLPHALFFSRTPRLAIQSSLPSQEIFPIYCMRHNFKQGLESKPRFPVQHADTVVALYSFAFPSRSFMLCILSFCFDPHTGSVCTDPFPLFSLLLFPSSPLSLIISLSMLTRLRTRSHRRFLLCICSPRCLPESLADAVTLFRWLQRGVFTRVLYSPIKGHPDSPNQIIFNKQNNLLQLVKGFSFIRFAPWSAMFVEVILHQTISTAC